MNEEFEDEQFEHLPFAGEGEMEFERGARRAAPARAPAARRAGKRPPGGGRSWPGPSGQRPPGPRRFGPWPGGLWPAYGWPYAMAPAAPPPDEPAPAAAEPEPEPADSGATDDDAAADQPQGEMPSTLSGTLTRLPAGQRPAYRALGAVAAAIGDPRSAGPGLYLIEFSSNGQRRAYSGQSANVRKRLQQHLLCARMLGLSLAGHQVYVAPLPAVAPAQRRAIEERIHADMFARSGGVLTNQRRELEVRLLGPQWA